MRNNEGAPRRNAWVDAPLPKITDRTLLQQWLDKGYITEAQIDDVFEELTPEQQLALDEARARWAKERPVGWERGNAWVNAPLLGILIHPKKIYPESVIEEEHS